MLIHAILAERFTHALHSLGFTSATIPLSKSTRPEFGEYQFNGAMALAKEAKRNPRDIAKDILQALEISDIAEKCEIAGPGFINIFLLKNWVSKHIQLSANDSRLNIQMVKAKKVVVDYSSPNLAKEMHVGHLRSTIIGDAVVRVLAFLGHDVVKQNHMGDWGTQFGMLLAHLADQLEQTKASTALSDLEDFYRAAKTPK